MGHSKSDSPWGALAFLGGTAGVIGLISQASENDSLKRQLAGECTRNAQLSEANVAFSRQAQQLQQRVQKLTTEASSFRESFEREQAAHAQTQKKATADISKLKGDVSQEKAAHAQTQASLAQAQAQVVKLQADLDARDTEIKNLSQQLQQLQAELVQASADAKRQEEELGREKAAHDQAQALKAQAQSEVAQLNLRNASMLGELEAKDKEIERLKDELEMVTQTRAPDLEKKES
jgi:chromosome segregation ATPase